MYHQPAGNLLALTISVVGNLSLGGFFFSWMFGYSHPPLPKDYGMIIFVLEFLNVAAIAAAYGIQKGNVTINASYEFLKKNPKLIIIAFLMTGVTAAGIALKSWVLPAYSAVGIIAKFFGRHATHDDRTIAHFILLILLTITLAVSPIIGTLFFLPLVILGLIYAGRPNLPRPQLFRDRIDVLVFVMPFIIFAPLFALILLAGQSEYDIGMIWAVIYFPSLAVGDVARFFQPYTSQEKAAF